LKKILIALLLTVVFLLLSGKALLIGENKVNPGDVYTVPDYGDLGKNGQSSLVCKYFTGRSIKLSVYWYSPNGILGKSECPFLLEKDY
jgi:hypothetical protein